MYFFDLHCDTISECEKSGAALYDNDLAVSLKKGAVIEKWVQTFAVFIHDKFTLKQQRELFFRQSDCLDREIAKNGLAVFGENEPQSGCTVLKSIENASFICGDFELIKRAAEQGFKMASLTWNAANAYAGGAESDGGLTPLGKSALKEFYKNGFVIDVSHLNDKSFYDVLGSFDGKIAASHSNARAVCSHKRNLTDDMLKQIAARGGVIGLNFYTLFLSSKNPGIEDIIRHAEHILNLCGENCVAIGSDFDGADMPEKLNSVSDIEKLYLLMIQYFGKAVADKIFFKNAYAFFAKK